MYFTPNFCAKDFPAENGEFVMFLDDVCLCVVKSPLRCTCENFLLVIVDRGIRCKILTIWNYHFKFFQHTI